MNERNVTHLLDIFAVVVKPAFRRQGLAFLLMNKAVHKAKAKHIPLMTITCTSSFTQQCAIKLGFCKEKSMYYKDWHCEGQKIVSDKNIDPVHPVAISYCKLL